MILSKTQTHARQNRQSFHTNNMQWTKMPSLLGLINPPCLYTQQTSHSFTEKAVGCADGCWDKETKHHVDTRTSQWTCSFWVSRCRKSKVVGILLVEILFKSHQSGFKPFFSVADLWWKRVKSKLFQPENDRAILRFSYMKFPQQTQKHKYIQKFKNILKIYIKFANTSLLKELQRMKVYEKFMMEHESAFVIFCICKPKKRKFELAAREKLQVSASHQLSDHLWALLTGAKYSPTYNRSVVITHKRLFCNPLTI